ncbi:MAG: RNA 2',3'-cyclic phosphodiesterase [Porticoccaceae bacterium]
MNPSDTVRSFLGIRPCAEGSAALVDAQRQFAQRHRSDEIRWSPEENLHLTLIFLGDQRPEQLQLLIQALNQHLRHPPFTLVMEGLTPFPNSPARILAARVNMSPELAVLHRQVAAVVDELGISRDTKSIKPHITLGRSRRNIFTARRPFHATSQAAALTLFQSENAGDGVRYRALAEFVFRQQ